MQAAAGFFGIHRYFCLQQHITCIQTNIHQHGCHTCHFLAVNDRPLDRCRTAELRKQGCMDIHTAQSRNIQDFFWQDLSKCNNNNHIRCHISQCLNKFRILLDADRLINRKIMGQSTFLDRWINDFLAAAFCLIRLGHNCCYLNSHINHLLQCRHCKIRCSHKYRFHHSAS